MSVSHDSETLAKGQQVFSATALIHHDFDGVVKVFLPKRASVKKFLPNVFELPGGHVDYGEEMVVGLAREIKEELDMNVRIGDPFACFTYLNEIKGSHTIEVVYFAEFTDPIENIRLDPEDHSTYVWISVDEIAQVYTENKGRDDDEFKVLQRGFELLGGASLHY